MMFRLGGLLLSGIFGFTALAAENTKLSTKYNVNSDFTTVTTSAGKTSKYDGTMTNYMFGSFKEALQGMAFVTSVMQTKGAESSESNSYWDYELKKRKSHAFLKLALQSPVTLLFEVEESYRSCKAKTGTSSSSSRYSEYGGGSSSSECSKQTSITVKGPVSVYGNFASSVNVDALLRDKQELEMTLGKNYSDEIEMTTRFSIKSVSFDESLARFFKVFNIPVFVSHGGDVGYGNGILDKISPLTSRQRMMLGISRIARSANERIMGL